MATPTGTIRPPELRRRWMFCAGADQDEQAAALDAAPDVLLPDLEDFTAPEHRVAARILIVQRIDACRARGIVAGVRVNPLETVGYEDLAVVMQGRPDVVLLPKTTSAAQVAALDRAVAQHEEKLGMPIGKTELVPNVETARASNLRNCERPSARCRLFAGIGGHGGRYRG